MPIHAKTNMGAVDDNFGRNKILSFFTESIFLPIQSLGRHCDHVFRKFVGNFDTVEFCDAVIDKLEQHPLLRVIVITAALSCTVPVMMFILFGITSFIVTFTAFIFIEGTILLLFGMSMFFSLVTMMLVLSLLAAVMMAFYILILKIELNNKIPDVRTSGAKFEPTAHPMGKMIFTQYTEHLS